MSELIRTEHHLGSYSTPEELYKAIGEYWSGSRFTTYMRCLRKGQYMYEDNLEVQGETPGYLITGSAVHAALNYYYAHGGARSEVPDLEERTLQVLRDSVEEQGGFPSLPPDHKYAHLSTGHLEVILKHHYFPLARAEDAFKPVTVHRDQLNMKDVIAARLRYTPEGLVLLGESAFLVRMVVQTPWAEKPREYVYAAIPDLPIVLGNSHYIMEHKTTGWNLGSGWAAEWRLDNTLRVYCLVVSNLISNVKGPEAVRGVFLNGISVQKRASDYKSKCTRVARYGPWDFEPSQLDEALWNHCAMLEIHKFIRESLGYFPQVTGKQCGTCMGFDLCSQSYFLRDHIAQLKYKFRNTEHLFKGEAEEDVFVD